MEVIKLLFAVFFTGVGLALFFIGLYVMSTFNVDLAASVGMIVGAYLCKEIVKVILRNE